MSPSHPPGRPPLASNAATEEWFNMLAERALATIPAELRRHVANVAIQVDDFPSEETRAEMALDSPYDLLGLYQGVSLDQRSVFHVHEEPDRIFLYRLPILAYCEDTGESLERVVRHVLIHEIGHYFGFSDDDMAAIETNE